MKLELGLICTRKSSGKNWIIKKCGKLNIQKYQISSYKYYDLDLFKNVSKSL